MSPEFGIGPGAAEFLALLSGKEVPLNTLLRQGPEPESYSLGFRVGKKGWRPVVQADLNLTYAEREKKTVSLVQLP